MQKNYLSRRRLSRRYGRSANRLFLERLEDRNLLAAYSLTDLGAFGGSGTAQAYDINEAGHVVGYAYTPSLQQHAFLWKDGAMHDLGTFPSGSSSKAFGLNNNGQVVGYAMDGSLAGGATNHAFLWEDGVMTDLIPAPQWSSANAINDAGQVVGTYNLNRPFIWQDGVLTDLGGFGGSASFGYAHDINNAGQVVGSSFVNNGSEGISQHAFIWENGAMTDLGAIPGLPDSRAHAINELGQVVGFSSSFDPDTTDEIYASFLYAGGVMIDLGVPGAAEDINDHGQIVGWTEGGAYIYEDGVATNLNTLIPPGSGFNLRAATGINNAGQVVGYGMAGGQFRAFLLTPVPAGTPTVSISDASVIEGHSGTTSAVFTVVLSAPASAPVSVSFANANSTASAGSDYVGQSGTLTFAPGQTTAQVIVAVNGDTSAEPNETFQLNLSNAMGVIIADGQGIGTIVDDEPRLSINDVSLLEGHSGTKLFVFTVTLSAPSSVPVTVNFATANGTAKSTEDYTAKSGTLTFAPGETTKTITIVVKGDRKREADESFFLNLTGAIGAVLQDGQGKGTIRNDD